MQILGEDGIGEFCAASPARREEQLAGLAAEQGRPARLLPWFELCSYVHAMARSGKLDVGAFRACWSDLVALLADMSTAGLLVHLGEWDLDDAALLQTLYELKRPPPRESSSGKKGARDADDTRKEEILRGRFQDLHERVTAKLNDHFKDERRRRQHGTPPQELPEDEYPARVDTMDIVVDTNVLVELLNALPIRDQSGTRLELSALGEPFRTRLLPALSRGIGKLIVPLSVLIETEGVIARDMDKKQKYQRADKVLRHMTALPHQSRSAAFSFEAMERDTFAAFLCLIERLVQDGVAVDSWPTLGDALVLAHGMANGCPVASYEWIHKDEWRRTQLDQAFPYLVLQ